MKTVPTEPLCMYCRKHPIERPWRPFCSERCRLIDLGDWAAERYRVPEAPREPDGQEK